MKYLSAYVCAAVFGAQLVAGSANIIGGTVASEGAAPYIVSIRKDGAHNCGGSIINSKYILTAGHCLMDVVPRSLTVVAGSNSVASGGVSRNVVRGVSHPDFDSIKRVNDLAVLELDTPLEPSALVQPISLYPSDDLPAGSNVTVYGWGYTSFPPGPRPTELHVVNRNTISNSDCDVAYMHYDSKDIYPSQICTQVGGHGTCQGDSGGPLTFVGEGDKVFQVGLVSFGVPCAQTYPDVFTRVSSFLPWIEENTTT